MDLPLPPLDFYDFLRRMRHPASADLVRSIKSVEKESRMLQAFLLTMETMIRDHPLWARTTEEEIDNALEGLEKYVMTKLFRCTFASSLADAESDKEISEKICLLQCFVKPKHLDVPEILYDEATWLIAVKELQKINAFKAPREKLLCILNCCSVINNLLHNASIATSHVPAGADDFLPALIYVTIKANPPQLHSNLKFIQLFRRHSKLISEVEYYLTNLISVKSFITNIDASSLTMEESEFQKNMQAARLASRGTVIGPSMLSFEDPGHPMRKHGKEIRSGGEKYPFMEAEAGELTVEDVQKLLTLYKQVVNNYTMLCKTVGGLCREKEAWPLTLSLKDEKPMPSSRYMQVTEIEGSSHDDLDEEEIQF